MRKSEHPLADLPVELRELVWNELFADATIIVQKLRSMSTTEATAKYSWDTDPDVIADSAYKLEVFTCPALDSYTYLTSFASIAAEIEKAFYNAAIFNFSGYDHITSEALLKLDSDRLKHIRCPASLLNCEQVKVKYPFAYSVFGKKALEREVALPRFPSLEALEITDMTYANGPIASSRSSAKQMRTFLHYKRNFMVTVTIDKVLKPEHPTTEKGSHVAKVVITRKTCKFEIDNEQFKDDRTEEEYRAYFGL